MSLVEYAREHDELRELRRLSEKGTAGPWVVHPVMAWISPAADLDLPICQMRMATDGESSEAQALVDAPLIVGAVNFVRALLAAQSVSALHPGEKEKTMTDPKETPDQGKPGPTPADSGPNDPPPSPPPSPPTPPQPDV